MLIDLRYSFCRVADDLVDNAASATESRDWIRVLSTYLDLCYPDYYHLEKNRDQKVQNNRLSPNEIPPSFRSAFRLLPIYYLSPKPLYELLEGFETDLEYSEGRFPIRNEQELEKYAERVAGTVAELCLELVFFHSPSRSRISDKQRQLLITSGGRMGVALQYVNIARDIATDAAMDRVYLPTRWLVEEGMVPQDLIKVEPGFAPEEFEEDIERLRARLLDRAFGIYEEAKLAMARLPREARGPLKVAVESYMEIGRVLRVEKSYKAVAEKATVPKWRRIKVAWKALKDG
jgi:15-cis-phytoene synthase/lycopene beta-cyclase